MADADCIRVRIDYETAGHSGYMLLDLHPSWAPFSCARFLKLVDSEFLDGQRFCRAIEGFVLDWNYGPCAGTSHASEHSQIYQELHWAKPRDVDAAGKLQQNLAGRISFGQEDDGSTKTEVFINLVDNSARLDSLGFVPFGEVVGATGGPKRLESWEGGRLSDFNFSHGDIFFSGGATPEKAQVRTKVLVAGGNGYIDKTYPGLTRLVRCQRCELEAAKSGDLKDAETVLALLAQLEERFAQWDTTPLKDSEEITKSSEKIDGRLLIHSEELMTAILEAFDLLQWLRKMPEDADYLVRVEIALGRSEMEVPAELWLSAEGRVDESKLSALTAVRTTLHDDLIYRPKIRFPSLDAGPLLDPDRRKEREENMETFFRT